jgi:hypothetical protein
MECGLFGEAHFQPITDAGGVSQNVKRLAQFEFSGDSIKRRLPLSRLTPVFCHVLIEALTGLDAFLMCFTGDFTQQSKFAFWEQTSSDVCHKRDTV